MRRPPRTRITVSNPSKLHPPHSRFLKNPEPDYQISRFIVRNKNATFTSRVIFLTIPHHVGRQTGLVLLFPPRLLSKGDRPIKNLLPISITQREHPPHLGEPGLTQGTPVPFFGAFLQGKSQQILRRHGVRQEHRQLRPILRHITTPSQHPHTQQHHTSARPQNKTATNPTVHHAPIQPHAHPPSIVVRLEDRNHNFTREQTPPTRPTHPASKSPDQTTCDDHHEHASRFRTHPNFTHPTHGSSRTLSLIIRSVVSLSEIKTAHSRRGSSFFPCHTMLGGRLLSYSSSHPASLAKATARSKISCRSASPKENALQTSVNWGLPKGRRYPLSNPSFRGRPNRSSAAMGSSRSTGNCDRSSPTSPTTPHPASTPTPSSITPRRDHETKPPQTPLSTMHQSNHTAHRAKRNPPEKTRPTRSHETKPHRHAPFGCSCVASTPGRCREGRCFLSPGFCVGDSQGALECRQRQGGFHAFPVSQTVGIGVLPVGGQRS